jgi:hypothetical protein
VTDCEFPRLQLRGSAGFSPASPLTAGDEDARTKEVEKEQNHSPTTQGQEEEWIEVYPKRLRSRYCTATATGFDAIPLATTTSMLAPVSMPFGTSKFVDTIFLPVATPIVLWPCVRK